MPILYNCRHDGDQYRITKFDEDMNPQGSYLTDGEACECPAGVRPTCRHRQMLPKFIGRSHVGDEWFFDFDRGGWVQMRPEWALEEENHSLDVESELPTPSEGPITTEQLDRAQFGRELHKRPPAPTHIKRRF